MTRIGQVKTRGPDVNTLALSPDGQTLFAALGTPGAPPTNSMTSLSAISVASMKPTKTVQLLAQIIALAESNNGGVLVAVVTQISASYAFVYDPQTLDVIKKITLPGKPDASPLALFNNGSTAYVSAESLAEVFQVDIKNGIASVFLPVKNAFISATGVALDASDKHLYVSDQVGNAAIFDIAAGNQSGSLSLGIQTALKLAESTDKSSIVAAGLCDCSDDFNHEAGTISSGSASVIKNFAIRHDANAVAVNGNGTEAFFYDSSFHQPYFLVYNPLNGGFLGYAAGIEPGNNVTSIAAQ